MCEVLNFVMKMLKGEVVPTTCSKLDASSPEFLQNGDNFRDKETQKKKEDEGQHDENDDDCREDKTQEIKEYEEQKSGANPRKLVCSKSFTIITSLMSIRISMIFSMTLQKKMKKKKNRIKKMKIFQTIFMSKKRTMLLSTKKRMQDFKRKRRTCGISFMKYKNKERKKKK